MLDKGTKKMETPRLILDKGTNSDVRKVYEYDIRFLKNDDNKNILINTAPEELNGWIDNPIEYYTLNRYEWFLFLKSTLDPICIITADRVKENEGKKSIELSYFMHPKYWGNGYTIEALHKILPYLLDEVGYDQVIARHAITNIKSKRVIEKLGFKLFSRTKENDYDNATGELVDTLDYFITSELLIKENNNQEKEIYHNLI